METLSIKDLKPIEGITKILDVLTEEQNVKVTTNSQLGSFLMDGFISEGFEVPDAVHKVNLETKPEPYKMFQLKNLSIFIDPCMTWTDTRLIIVDKNNETKEIMVEHSNNLI